MEVLNPTPRTSHPACVPYPQALTLAEVSAVAAQAVTSAPTLCMVGDLTNAPRYDAVKAMY